MLLNKIVVEMSYMYQYCNVLHCIVLMGVKIAAQCTSTVLRSIVLPRI